MNKKEIKQLLDHSLWIMGHDLGINVGEYEAVKHFANIVYRQVSKDNTVLYDTTKEVDFKNLDVDESVARSLEEAPF